MSLHRHWPRRPAWTCAACGDEQRWPCEVARDALLIEYDDRPHELAEVMWQFAHQAAMDALPAERLWGQFLVWTPGTADVPSLN